MKDYFSDPIRIPASNQFIKGFTGKVNRFYFGSFLVLLVVASAFTGSFFSIKLIYLVSILGTAYWAFIIFIIGSMLLLLLPKDARKMMLLPYYGSMLALILFINCWALYDVVQHPSNILRQRLVSAASLVTLLGPTYIWHVSRKIKITSSLEGESGKET